MGRTKKSVDVGDATTKALDSKSKAIDKAKERISREKANKSYREASDSELSEREEVEKFGDPKDKDFSDEAVSASEESEWGGDSSGSEYGKKKKKSPAKAVGKGRGRGRGAKASVSPKGKGAGRGRGRPARNGSKKTPTKASKKGRDDSDDSASEAGSSGSEYGKKKITPAKKRGPPAKASPKKRPAPSSNTEGRSRRGRQASAKSYKEVSEDDLEVSEEEKKPVSKRAKLDPKPKENAKKESKKSKKESDEEEEEDQSMDDEEEKEDEKIKKNGNGNAVEKKQDKDSKDSEEEDDKESKKSDSEDEVKEKPAAKKSPVSENEEDEEEEEKKPAVAANELKNRTETDYSTIDFECDKKSPKGDAWNYKISCWNIGGIKSWIKKNGLEYLKKENPDVMCFVEVKCNEKSKPEELTKIEGYPHSYWSYNAENAGQHGVAILSKTEAKHVQYGFPIEDSDSADDKTLKEKFTSEGRLVTLEYENFYLINAYVPNSGRPEKSDKFPKGYPPKVANEERQKFDTLFRTFVKDLEKKKPVIVTGDLNVAHQEIDLTNPKTNDRTAGFTKEEREGFTQLLEETTLIDSFRALYPDQKSSYTFWSYMHNSRAKNIGWRLDYFLLSEKLRDSLCESVMRSEVYGSDHCPITLFIKN